MGAPKKAGDEKSPGLDLAGNARKVVVVVAPRRTVHADDDKRHGPGEKIEVSQDEADRLQKAGFVLASGKAARRAAAAAGPSIETPGGNGPSVVTAEDGSQAGNGAAGDGGDGDGEDDKEE
jgi:hypothetical protein